MNHESQKSDDVPGLVSVLNEGRMLFKVAFACGQQGVEPFVRAMREKRPRKLMDVFTLAQRCNVGCENCLTVLSKDSREGATAESPKGKEPDPARMNFADPRSHHLGKAEQAVMLDMTDEYIHQDHLDAAARAKEKRGG